MMNSAALVIFGISKPRIYVSTSRAQTDGTGIENLNLPTSFTIPGGPQPDLWGAFNLSEPFLRLGAQPTNEILEYTNYLARLDSMIGALSFSVQTLISTVANLEKKLGELINDRSGDAESFQMKHDGQNQSQELWDRKTPSTIEEEYLSDDEA